MGGLAKLCKMYGRIDVKVDGDVRIWVWDYANDKPRLKEDMSEEEIMASEKAKWMGIKENKL